VNANVILQMQDVTLESRSDTRSSVLVEHFTLTLGAGDSHALVGESGAGKSLTARSVLGLLPGGVTRSHGRIALAGQSIEALTPAMLRKLRGRVAGFIPQDPMRALNPVRRIASLLDEVIARHSTLGWRERAARARTALTEVELSSDVLGRYAHELSGGMRQRVLIALAIANSPQLLIADEPTTALDATVQAEILDLLSSLLNSNTALLLITHDLAVAASLCRHMSVMRHGRIIESGEAARLLQTPSSTYARELIRESFLAEP